MGLPHIVLEALYHNIANAELRSVVKGVAYMHLTEPSVLHVIMCNMIYFSFVLSLSSYTQCWQSFVWAFMRHDMQRGSHILAVPYLLDQTPLLISHCSRIVAAPPDILNKIVAALEY